MALPQSLSSGELESGLLQNLETGSLLSGLQGRAQRSVQFRSGFSREVANAQEDPKERTYRRDFTQAITNTLTLEEGE